MTPHIIMEDKNKRKMTQNFTRNILEKSFFKALLEDWYKIYRRTEDIESRRSRRGTQKDERLRATFLEFSL